MSTNLEWFTVPKNGRSLPIGLKWALQKKCGGYVNFKFDHSDIGYFEGLRDGGLEEVQEVIAAIEKHGTIIIKEV